MAGKPMNLDPLEFIWDKLFLAGFLNLWIYSLKSLLKWKSCFFYCELIKFLINYSIYYKKWLNRKSENGLKKKSNQERKENKMEEGKAKVAKIKEKVGNLH